jgi:hypothetical protein
MNDAPKMENLNYCLGRLPDGLGYLNKKIGQIRSKYPVAGKKRRSYGSDGMI